MKRKSKSQGGPGKAKRGRISRGNNGIHQGETAQAERPVIQVAFEEFKSFREKCYFSPYEKSVLRSTFRLPVSPRFCKTLKKVLTLRTECNAFMQSQYSSRMKGIIKELDHLKEAALGKLSRWTNEKFEHGGMPDKIGKLYGDAMMFLQEKPELMKKAFDEYCRCRSMRVLDIFYKPLKHGQYLAEILSSMHYAVTLEKFNLATLLKACDVKVLGDRQKPEIIHDALSRITKSLRGPVRHHVCGTLRRKELIHLHRRIMILNIHSEIMDRLAPRSVIASTVHELLQASENKFWMTLNMCTQLYVEEPLQPIEHNLTPAPPVQCLLEVLKEVLGFTAIEGRDTDMQKMAITIVFPLRDALQTRLSDMPPREMNKYIINCIFEIQSVLCEYDCLRNIVRRLDANVLHCLRAIEK